MSDLEATTGNTVGETPPVTVPVATAPKVKANGNQDDIIRDLMKQISDRDKALTDKTKNITELTASIADQQAKSLDYETKLKARQTADENKLQKLLAEVPEDKKVLIPVGLDTAGTLAYLDKAASFIFGKNATFAQVKTEATVPAGDSPVSQPSGLKKYTTAELRNNPALVVEGLKQMKSR